MLGLRRKLIQSLCKMLPSTDAIALFFCPRRPAEGNDEIPPLLSDNYSKGDQDVVSVSGDSNGDGDVDSLSDDPKGDDDVDSLSDDSKGDDDVDSLSDNPKGDGDVDSVPNDTAATEVAHAQSTDHVEAFNARFDNEGEDDWSHLSPAEDCAGQTPSKQIYVFAVGKDRRPYEYM